MIRLGWSQLAVVASGVATVLLVVCVAFAFEWQEFYIQAFALPRIAQRYGFEFGTVTFSRENEVYAWPGVINLNPNGELARIGVRRHDMPIGYHGYGATAMYGALMAAERGEDATFGVVNAEDWSAGREGQAFRTIHAR